MKNFLFFSVTGFIFLTTVIGSPLAVASAEKTVDILEEKNIEQKIKQLSDEWQKQFVEAVNDFLENELNRLQDKKTEPQKNLGRQIEKFEEDVKRGSTDPETFFSLGRLYDRKGDGANAIIHTKKAEEIFLKKEDVKGVAEARRSLRNYYEKYNYKPEDFELTK